MLRNRGHLATSVEVGFKDAALLKTAEEQGAAVITADSWFLKELFRYPRGHRHCFRRAGVIQVHGEWDQARQRLLDYLPIIEAVHLVRMSQADSPLGINLSTREVRILEPTPSATT